MSKQLLVNNRLTVLQNVYHCRSRGRQSNSSNIGRSRPEIFTNCLGYRYEALQHGLSWKPTMFAPIPSCSASKPDPPWSGNENFTVATVVRVNWLVSQWNRGFLWHDGRLKGLLRWSRIVRTIEQLRWISNRNISQVWYADFDTTF